MTTLSCLNVTFMMVEEFFYLFQLFTFADTYRGRYDSSITAARRYYQSESGYNVCILYNVHILSLIQALGSFVQ